MDYSEFTWSRSHLEFSSENFGHHYQNETARGFQFRTLCVRDLYIPFRSRNGGINGYSCHADLTYLTHFRILLGPTLSAFTHR